MVRPTVKRTLEEETAVREKQRMLKVEAKRRYTIVYESMRIICRINVIASFLH